MSTKQKRFLLSENEIPTQCIGFDTLSYNEKNKDCKLVLTDFESEDKFIEKILDNNDIVDNVYKCIDEHISIYINNYTNDKE